MGNLSLYAASAMLDWCLPADTPTRPAGLRMGLPTEMRFRAKDLRKDAKLTAPARRARPDASPPAVLGVVVVKAAKAA
jgi:hypothetical protein